MHPSKFLYPNCGTIGDSTVLRIHRCASGELRWALLLPASVPWSRILSNLPFKSALIPNPCLMSIPTLPLFSAAQQHARDPQKIAILDTTKQQSFTFVQLLADAAAFKECIVGALQLTDDLNERRIAFLVPNGYDYVVTQWAVWAAGGVCVPLCRLFLALEAIRIL